MKQITSTSHARLHELFIYDPETGVWTWRIRHCTARPGAIAGCSRPDGYRVIGIDGSQYLAHRLAVVYMTGEWPLNEVDHIDGDPSNGKWDNLRCVDRTTNSQNQRRPKGKRQPDAMLGASFDKRRGVWRARIIIHKIEHFIGYFASPAEAHAAYLEAKRAHHDGCTI